MFVPTSETQVVDASPGSTGWYRLKSVEDEEAFGYCTISNTNEAHDRISFVGFSYRVNYAASEFEIVQLVYAQSASLPLNFTKVRLMRDAAAYGSGGIYLEIYYVSGTFAQTNIACTPGDSPFSSPFAASSGAGTLLAELTFGPGLRIETSEEGILVNGSAPSGGSGGGLTVLATLGSGVPEFSATSETPLEASYVAGSTHLETIAVNDVFRMRFYGIFSTQSVADQFRIRTRFGAPGAGGEVLLADTGWRTVIASLAGVHMEFECILRFVGIGASALAYTTGRFMFQVPGESTPRVFVLGGGGAVSLDTTETNREFYPSFQWTDDAGDANMISLYSFTLERLAAPV